MEPSNCLLNTLNCFTCSKLSKMSFLVLSLCTLSFFLCYKEIRPTVKGLVIKSNMASYEKSKNVQYRMKLGAKITN